MTNKIIFLDIDGVITSARSGWHRFDLFAVQFLNWVCEKSNAKIVISSTWRYNHPKEEFEVFFKNNIHEDWRTSTKLLTNGSRCRGDEIQLWLNSHPEVTKYLILDDDHDMLDSQLPNCIFTQSYNGILFEDMVKIKDFFDLPVYNGDLNEFPDFELVNSQLRDFKKPKTKKTTITTITTTKIKFE